MKIDLTQPIKDFKGRAITAVQDNTIAALLEKAATVVENITDAKTKALFLNTIKPPAMRLPITAGDVICDVLAQPAEKMPGREKLERYKLGMKCTGDSVKLSKADRKLIQELVENSNYSPIVYGRIVDLFKPKK